MTVPHHEHREGVGRVAEVLRRAKPGHVPGLVRVAHWLAIPSISGDPDRRADLVLAAGWLVRQIRRTGGGHHLFGVPGGGPIVVGCWAGPAGAPAVMLYGHYDVKPAGPGWTVPPFRPTVSGQLMFGRGANDDKGQVLAALSAIEAWQREGGVPVTVVLVADGGEEIGSPGLPQALVEVARRFSPSAILVCDTERGVRDAPTLTLSQRGHLGIRITAFAGGPALHSGRFGGAVVDPTVVLFESVARLARFVARWPQAQLGRSVAERWVCELADDQIEDAARGRVLAGTDLYRKITAGASLTVSRTSKTAPAGAIPGRAVVEVDVRLPPGTDPAPAFDMLCERLGRSVPPGIRISCSLLQANTGLCALPDGIILSTIERASRETFGRAVELTRSGGSLPATQMLHRAFGLAPVLLGLGTPASGAHGPDEFLDIPGWCRSVELLVRVFAGLAKANRSRAFDTARIIGRAPVDQVGVTESKRSRMG